VPTATKKYISDEQKSLIDKLLLERLSLAAISRITGISESWIQRYVNNKSIYTSEAMGVEPSKKMS
jgi:transposase